MCVWLGYLEVCACMHAWQKDKIWTPAPFLFFLKLSTEVCQAFLKGCDNLLDRTLQGGLKTLEDCENKAQYLTSASSAKVNTANCLYRNILIKSCFLPFSFIRLVNTITWFCFPWSPTFQSLVCVLHCSCLPFWQRCSIVRTVLKKLNICSVNGCGNWSIFV